MISAGAGWLLMTVVTMKDTGKQEYYQEGLFSMGLCIKQAKNYWQRHYMWGNDKLWTLELTCMNRKNEGDYLKIICNKEGACNI